MAIGGRREDALRGTAHGTSIQCSTVDVAVRSSVDAFFEWAAERLGGIDVMINAAGINIKNRSMAEMRPEQWDQVMAINATGAYNCLRAVLPEMRSRKRGLIINISTRLLRT